jgi:replicative DNA helicase
MIPVDDLIPVSAERLVMGQVLYEPDVITKAAVRLKPEHFGDGRTRNAYETALDLWRKGGVVDLLTVTYAMHKGGWNLTDASTFLSECMYNVASTKHFDDHAAIVREHYGLRTLRIAGHEMVKGAVVGKDPVSLMSGLNVDFESATATESDDVNGAEIAYALLNTANKPKPIYLGMGPLDDLVFVMPDNFITLRAIAGAGKTAFLLSSVLNLLPARKVWFVSLEMSAADLMARALCQLAMVNIDSMMMDRLDNEQRDRLAKCANDYGHILKNLLIDNAGTMNIDVFRAKADHKVKNEKCELIVVDYAQLMDADAKRYPSQTERLEVISKSLRATARTLQVPILCVVHVNKEGVEHGTIQFEKDAHVRLSLSREPGKDIMEAEVLKNRNGKVGVAKINCLMQYGIVGRTTPPAWADRPDPAAPYNPRQGFDHNHVTPERDDSDFAPF